MKKCLKCRTYKALANGYCDVCHGPDRHNPNGVMGFAANNDHSHLVTCQRCLDLVSDNIPESAVKDGHVYMLVDAPPICENLEEQADVVLASIFETEETDEDVAQQEAESNIQLEEDANIEEQVECVGCSDVVDEDEASYDKDLAYCETCFNEIASKREEKKNEPKPTTPVPKPRNRKEAILQALEEQGNTTTMERLCGRADELRTQKEGPSGYRKTVIYLGNLEGIWKVTGTKGKESITLEEFITPRKPEKVEKKPEPEPTVVETPSKQTTLPERPADDRATNGIYVIEPDVEDFIRDPKRVPTFIDYFDCYATMDAHFLTQENLLIEGPPGQAKTLGAINWAVSKGHPTVIVPCNSSMKEHDLIGTSGMRGNETIFTLGALPQAIVLANKCGNATLVLDELPGLPEKVQILLHALDWRREIYIPKLKTMFRVKDGCNLMIVATGNPADSYAGLNELNPALSERFPTQKIGYPDPDTELIIVNLEDADEELSEEFKKQLIRVANQTRAWVQEKGYGYPISTRALHKFIRLYRAYRTVKKENGRVYFTEVRAREKAIRNVFLNKMNDEEQAEWFKNDVIDPTFHTRFSTSDKQKFDTEDEQT